MAHHAPQGPQRGGGHLHILPVQVQQPPPVTVNINVAVTTNLHCNVGDLHMLPARILGLSRSLLAQQQILAQEALQRRMQVQQQQQQQQQQAQAQMFFAQRPQQAAAQYHFAHAAAAAGGSPAPPPQPGALGTPGEAELLRSLGAEGLGGAEEEEEAEEEEDDAGDAAGPRVELDNLYAGALHACHHSQQAHSGATPRLADLFQPAGVPAPAQHAGPQPPTLNHILWNIEVSEVLRLARGDWSPCDRHRPAIAECLRQACSAAGTAADLASSYADRIMQQLAPHLQEPLQRRTHGRAEACLVDTRVLLRHYLERLINAFQGEGEQRSASLQVRECLVTAVGHWAVRMALYCSCGLGSLESMLPHPCRGLAGVQHVTQTAIAAWLESLQTRPRLGNRAELSRMLQGLAEDAIRISVQEYGGKSKADDDERAGLGTLQQATDPAVAPMD
eukprot:TRINITY_DN6649_c2_g1_i1.p1 TRINITY_DN6649_c2_g1~~TRINITY_DN6649_c2_g1_i1.p1  ORF type:complete len:477 (+),score=137.73 TRINITY_DN6649_c2_g1_i1:91-1431(+)